MSNPLDISPVRASAVANVTAGGAGDNTQVVGIIVDRAAYNWPDQCLAAIAFTATLATTKKLTLKTVLLEHGDAANLSDAANLYAPADVDVAVDPGGGSTITGTKKYDWSLRSAKRYIRLKFTPDMDAGSVDTSVLSSQLLLSGSYIGPAV